MKVQITIDLDITCDGTDIGPILDAVNHQLCGIMSYVEEDTGYDLDYDKNNAVCVNEVKA